MSKRITVSYNERFHLFEEQEQKDSIYLEIEDIRECAFELWQMSNNETHSRAIVKIPIKYWIKMVEDWKSSSNREKVDKKELKFD